MILQSVRDQVHKLKEALDGLLIAAIVRQQEFDVGGHRIR
jgi:hypothetical protein